MLSPGCSSGSGTLPAASRSNTLSKASSASDLCGATGSGLLTSDGVGGLGLGGDAEGMVAALRFGLDNGGCGPPAAPFASLAAPGLISFPCRELGGGGGFFEIVGGDCKLGCAPRVKPRRSSSPSCSDVSRDVCGVSGTGCNISDMDWREAEAVSAVLAPSPLGIGGCLLL
jgi:hypothetical protein